MYSIRKCKLQEGTLLESYRKMEGCYTDCYVAEVRVEVGLPGYVRAFYCTPLFKLERLILKLAVNRPSTDNQAHQLGNGKIDHFAAWTVEKRTHDQLLMCDMSGRTRSWFMVEPVGDNAKTATRLYFGSAVVRVTTKDKQPTLGFLFSALLGFHKLYSRALLWSAKVGI